MLNVINQMIRISIKPEDYPALQRVGLQLQSERDDRIPLLRAKLTVAAGGDDDILAA